MSQTKIKYIHNAAVLYNDDNPNRWFDAFGPNINKYVTHFESLPMVGADNPSEWTVTLVEAGGDDSTVILTGVRGGELLLSTDANEDDGISMQLTGESFGFDGQYPLYFGIKFKVDEATQSDFLVGLAITDVAMLGGVTDGIYFRKVDATTAVNFVLEKDSVETTTSIDVCVADVYVTYEFYYDGAFVWVYVDGDLVATFTAANEANLPNDEVLTLSMEFLTGDAVAQDMTVDWLRVIQINE
jgi:hypothetical protein